MTQDRPLFGMILMLGFCVVAPMGDAVAKILGQSVPLAQLLLIRFAVQAIILFPIVWITARPWLVHGRILRLTVYRTLLHIFGIGAMFTALQYLPLADAVAIAFVMPFIMLLLGKLVLDEEVGHRRLIACGIGFVGTLMVVQPSFAAVGWPALLPLLVAVNFSVFILITRQIAKYTDPIGLQATSGFLAILIMVPAVLLLQDSDLPGIKVISPTPLEWTLLVSIGILGTLAHLLMTWSLRYAPSTTLAPMQYLEIPIATVIGFLVFADLPNGLAALGILVIMGAGLYVVMRERAIALHQARPDTQTPDRKAACVE